MIETRGVGEYMTEAVADTRASAKRLASTLISQGKAFHVLFSEGVWVFEIDEQNERGGLVSRWADS